MRFAHSLLIFSLAALQAQGVSARPSEIGTPPSELFMPKDYGGHDQNWWIDPGGDGVLRVANNHGILEYDGSRWQRTPIPTGGRLYSVVRDPEGRLFVGLIEKFGVLAPAADGLPSYRRLSASLTDRGVVLGEIRDIAVTPAGVLFMGQGGIARWRDGAELDFIPVLQKQGFLRLLEIEGEIYVADNLWGLARWSPAKLEPALDPASRERLRQIPGGDRILAGRTMAILPWGEGRLLVTDRGGLFYHEDNRWSRFETAADAVLERALVYRAIKLDDGSVAVGTLLEGVLVLGPDGRWLQSFPAAGKAVTFLVRDQEGSIWAALLGGVARLEIPSPLSTLGPQHGLDGSVEAIVRYQGRLMVGTHLGRFELQPATEPGIPHFLRRDREEVWSLLSTGESLLAGSQAGLREITEGRSEWVIREMAVRSLLASRRRADVVLAGLDHGLALVERRGSGWYERRRLQGIHENISSIVEEPGGTLWLGTHSQGLLRVRNWEDPGATTVERFGGPDGLPTPVDKGHRVRPFRLDGETVFGTAVGLYRHRPGASPAFTPSDALGTHFGSGGGDVYQAAQLPGGNVWIRSDLTGLARRTADGRYSWDPFVLAASPPPSTNAFFPDEDGTLWIGSRDGVHRVGPEATTAVRPPARPPAVRRLLDAEGVVRWKSSGTPAEVALPHLSRLRIEYSGGRLAQGSATELQVRLQGIDDDWSTWSHETQRDYTQLPGGSYTFSVRARDAFGHVTESRPLGLRIRRQWHETWWGKASLAAAASALLAAMSLAVSRRRNRRLERRTQELEVEVAAP